MKDKTHIEFIENWAQYVYENKKSRLWKKQHKEFINSQINKSNKTLFRIAKIKGIETIAKLRNITNIKVLEKYK